MGNKARSRKEESVVLSEKLNASLSSVELSVCVTIQVGGLLFFLYSFHVASMELVQRPDFR